MKKILKLIVLLFISNYGYSQIYYSHYLDATSEWRVIEHHGEAAYHDITFKTIFFDGFQNINGYTYYKMYQTYYKVGYSMDYSILFPQSSTITQLIGYFREDTTGKFYLYNNGLEITYFDSQPVLNAQIGDFVFGQFSQSSCQVDYIGNNLFNSINLKQIKCDTSNGSNGTANFVEGVGNINNSCYSQFQQDNSLMTFERIYFYSKQGQNLTFYDNVYTPFGNNGGYIYYYSFANADHQALSTLTYGKNDIKIFPNPASNILNIETANQENIDAITIYNTLGQEALSINNPSSKINIEKLKSGTYFIKVKIGTEEINSKFIKE